MFPKRVELKDLQTPALVGGLSVATCLLVRKLKGVSLGTECGSFKRAYKAFALITVVGGVVKIYNIESSEKL